MLSYLAGGATVVAEYDTIRPQSSPSLRWPSRCFGAEASSCSEQEALLYTTPDYQQQRLKHKQRPRDNAPRVIPHRAFSLSPLLYTLPQLLSCSATFLFCQSTRPTCSERWELTLLLGRSASLTRCLAGGEWGPFEGRVGEECCRAVELLRSSSREGESLKKRR